MKFIKLHLLNDEEIYINMDHIESFGKVNGETYDKYDKEYEGTTYLIQRGVKYSDDVYVVKESVDKVCELLTEYV